MLATFLFIRFGFQQCQDYENHEQTSDIRVASANTTTVASPHHVQRRRQAHSTPDPPRGQRDNGKQARQTAAVGGVSEVNGVGWGTMDALS
ncbi:hypothetical protein CSPX01_16295 [Colletotrichum filicis]|nr:hypothetical protein CSPX01_16295 [Colletotrichum filicis]